MTHSAFRRVFALLIELAIFWTIATVCYVVYKVVYGVDYFDNEVFYDLHSSGLPGLPKILLMVLSMMILKDIPGNGSVVKRLLSLSIIDRKTGMIASPFQRVLRNIPLIVLPLEALVFFATKKQDAKRIGDRLAGTAVVEWSKARPMLNFSWGNRIKAFAIALIPMAIMFWPIYFFDFAGSNRDNYLPEEKDIVKSEQLTSAIQGYFGTDADKITVDYYNRSARNLVPRLNIFVKLNNKQLFERQASDNFMEPVLLHIFDSLLVDTNYMAALDVRFYASGERKGSFGELR